MTFTSWEENAFCILMGGKETQKQVLNLQGYAKASFVCGQKLILTYILIQYIVCELIIF